MGGVDASGVLDDLAGRLDVMQDLRVGEEEQTGYVDRASGKSHLCEFLQFFVIRCVVWRFDLRFSCRKFEV